MNKIHDHNSDQEKIIGKYYNASIQDVEELLNCAQKKILGKNEW